MTNSKIKSKSKKAESQKSLRDTQKYLVEWETAGDGTDWGPVCEFEKPMSRSRAAALFFTMWLRTSFVMSIDEVRKAFPTSLSSYFTRNKEKKQFDSLVWFSTDDIHAETESGFKVEIEKAKWYLYPAVYEPKTITIHHFDNSDPAQVMRFSRLSEPHGLGHGPVRGGTAFISKVWSKDDFENLLAHIEKNKDTLFTRVRIVPA